MKKWLAAALLAVISSGVHAGSSLGKVKQLMPIVNNVVIFRIENHINEPACSINGGQWALSLATETGKAQYALLLAAAAQGSVVEVMGSNACTAYGDREAPVWISVSY